MEIRESARQRIEKASQNNLCFACLEKLKAVRGPDGEFLKWDEIRHVHPRCYHATMRAIRNQKTTEAVRMAEGKLGAKGPFGPKPTNPVTKDVS